MAIVLGLVVGLAVMAPAAALEEAVSDLVLIRDEDVVADDLLAGGNIIRIKGTVEGDLVAAAFEVIEVDGTVTGDLLALAPRVIIRGEVLGSVRTLAATTVIEGTVGGDLLIGGGWLVVTGSVASDVHGAVVDVAQEGDIGGSAKLRALRARIDGEVGADIEGTIRRLAIGDEATIGGDVVIRGSVDVADGAEVGGRARTPESRAVPLRARAYAAIGILVGLSIWLLAGPAVEWLAPDWLERHRGGKSMLGWLGWGSVSVGGAVVLVGGLGLLTAASSGEAAVVLGIVTVFLVFATLVLLAAAALVGAVPASVRIGEHIGSPPSRVSSHVRGVAVIAVLAWIPWIGSIVVALFLLLAIGAVMVRKTT